MATALDLTHQPFGYWRVLGRGSLTKHGQFWVCLCHAGCAPHTQVELHEAALLEGRTRSCGCDYVSNSGQRHRMRDFVGQQFGQYLVLQMEGLDKNNHRRCVAQCTCKAEKRLYASQLLSGTGLSCRKCQVARTFTKVRLNRWYNEWFVLSRVASVEAQKRLRSRFLCQCGRCGRQQEVYGSDLVSGHSRQCRYCAHPHYGVLEAQEDRVFALLTLHKSSRAIAREVGCTSSAVGEFLQRHQAYRVLIESLSAEEELIAEVP